MPPLISLLLLGTVLYLGRQFLHRRIRLSLAAPRVEEQGSPADLGLAFETCAISGPNGKNLHAWWVPASELPGPVTVILHGWGGNSEMMLPLVPPLHQSGFHVLLLDARCHGQSDEDSFASLPRFAEDLEAALNWLGRHPQAQGQPLSLIGHSVGAAAVLLVASRHRELAAVVSISAFSHPAAMMGRVLAAKGLPYFPFGWYVLRYVEKTIGHRFDHIAPIHTISRVSCPTLLVHGEQDDTVPVEEARLIHANRKDKPVELLILSGTHDSFDDLARHMDCLTGFLYATNRQPPSSGEPAQRRPGFPEQPDCPPNPNKHP